MADTSRIPVIVSAVRTPIGRFLGGLSPLSAPELGGVAIREAVRRSGVDLDDIEEVIMGNVIQGGVGQAPARQAALKSVMLASQAIKAGDLHVAVAGGQESMSNAPYYMYGLRNGVKAGDQTLVDGMIKDGLWCAFCDVHMGSHAEYTAKKAEITRERQDEFALASHQKAIAAIEGGRFKAEIVPVQIPGRKGPTTVDTDESPRKDTSLDALAKLRPAFPAKSGPNDDLTVTAGNAPGLNDGASALVVTSEEYARAHGLTIMARVTGYGSGAVDPQD